MGRGFKKSRGAYTAKMDDQERMVLATLFSQTADLLRTAGTPAPHGAATGTEEPDGVGDDVDEFERLMRSAGLDGAVDGDAKIDDGAAQGPSDVINPTVESGLNEGALSSDPALGRLLPDAHHDDPLAAAEFRRFSADGVRRAKIARLEQAQNAVSPDGKPLRLSEDDAIAVLVSLTDVRLVLAERIGLHDEADVEALEVRVMRGQVGEDAALIYTYDFLTWLQETLAGALS